MGAAEDINWREFMAGEQACIDGEPCPENASESFQRGYGARYELEQVQGEISERQHQRTH